MTPIKVNIGGRTFTYKVIPYETSCSEMGNLDLRPADETIVTVDVNGSDLT
jgi:hypothetical protein